MRSLHAKNATKTPPSMPTPSLLPLDGKVCSMRRKRVFTWHVHGNYLYYLAHADVDFFLPVMPGKPGYSGRGTTFPFADNVHDIPAEEVKRQKFDCVLFQHRRNYEVDQYDVLSPT